MMQTLLLLGSCSAVALLGLWLLQKWAVFHRVDLQSSSRFLDDYYRSAQKLMGDDSVPDTVAEFIEIFSRHAGEPVQARQFALHIIFGRFVGRKKSTSEKAKIFAKDLSLLPMDKKIIFADIVANGLAASASADPLFSRWYLMVLNVFFSISGRKDDRSVSIDRASTAAVDISNSFEGCLAT